MTKFIWVRDSDKTDHYVNVNHIIRVTTRAARGQFSAGAWIILRDSKEIHLSQDEYDTADDVIEKIRIAING